MSRPFEEYRGRNCLNKVDADQREALEAWEEVLRMGEAGKVDCEHFIDEQLYLTAETAECTGITNYFVWDADKYDFSHPSEDPNWLEISAPPRRKRNRVREKFGFHFVPKV